MIHWSWLILSGILGCALGMIVMGAVTDKRRGGS